jgi:hypothetical protein
MTTSENNKIILNDIFERFDEYYNAGRFDLVDAELVERSKFFDRAKANILANEPERLVGLLGGLE